MASIIKFDNVEFILNKDKIININFDISEKKIIELQGSMRKEILKLTASIIKYKRGKLTLDGKIVFCPENCILYQDMTIKENFEFYCNIAHKKREVCTEVLKMLDLEKDKNTMVLKLSDEEKTICQIGIFSIFDFDIFLIEEPFLFLESKGRKIIIEYLNKLNTMGKTIIYSVTDTENISFSNKVIKFLDSGEGI